MISKQLFCEALESMKTLSDYQTEKNKLYKKYKVDGFLIEPTNDQILLKVIRELFKECTEIEALETFCYENNFGRGKGNQKYIDADGQSHTIISPEQLYDFLISHLGGD